MMRPTKTFFFATALLALFVLNFAGCAGTMKAIDSRKLETTVRMSETIFLEPVEPEERIVWIDARNTSDQQDLDTAKILAIIKEKVLARGYKVTDSPKKAHYRLQANVLYASREKEGLTEEGMLLGGFGAGLAGSRIGGGRTSRAAATVGGATLGALVGGIVGSKIQVNKYLFTVDVQISEKVAGGVATSSSGKSRSGGVSKSQSATGKSNYVKYRTRVVGTAKQTNMKWEEARQILIEKFSASLAGIF